MSLNAGSRLGPYEILAPIGAGGMGEVYRARDTELNRDIAIKVLPDAFADDPERAARFRREAQTLAALNHPHIAQIYGIEESSGTRALLMELVEGETLADRLAHAPIALDEALAIAKQIAEALEAAHEHGIIHRDLKPANIKLRPDGTVKVLDFGLAKTITREGGASPSVSMSPTLATPAMTGAGMILGTAAYMAPEQAKGHDLDRRADIWAFGCVLYEMLTGHRAFTGDSVTEVLASVLRSDVDWRAVPAATPAHVRTLLQRCLEKDPRERLRDIGDAWLELRKPIPVENAATERPAARTFSWARATAWVLAGGLAGVAGALGVSSFQSVPPPRVARFVLSTVPDAPLAISTNNTDVAISPDGTHIAYTAGSLSQIYVRPIDRVTGTLLKGTEGATNPIFSPDGAEIAYYAGGFLKKVAVTGGPPVTLCPAGAFRGGSWLNEDALIVSVRGQLLRVPAAGGEPTPIAVAGDRALLRRWPEVLPGARSVLFVATRGSATATFDSATATFVLDLNTLEERQLIPTSSHPRYSSTGHIIYGVQGTLHAVPFHVERLEVTGTPVPLVSGVLTKSSGAVDYAISADGSLVYIAGGAAGVERRIVTVDRSGRKATLADIRPDAYRDVRVSPDGGRVAVATSDDIWTYDMARATFSRLTTHPAEDRSPMWTPDGQRLVFTSTRGSRPELFARRADGTGDEQRLLTFARDLVDLRANQMLTGERLIITEVPPQIQCAVGQVVADAQSASMLLKNEFCNDYGTVSPDGRWIAYDSDVSGRAEIYVERYPDLGERQQISSGGGRLPVWSRDGRELYFLGVDGRQVFRVPVQAGATLRIGRPDVLFQGEYLPVATGFRPYDVLPDGRFVLIEVAADSSNAVRPDVILVQNWAQELTRRLATKD